MDLSRFILSLILSWFGVRKAEFSVAENASAPAPIKFQPSGDCYGFVRDELSEVLTIPPRDGNDGA